MRSLVSTAWLAEQLSADDLILFDASWYLPAEQRDPLAEFRQAHIPGARCFDIDAIADTESSLPHMAPTAAVRAPGRRTGGRERQPGSVL